MLLHVVYGQSLPAVWVRVVQEHELQPIDPSLLCFLDINTQEGIEAAAGIPASAA